MAYHKNVLIVGAGLCGTLLALRLAQRGFNVELHEKRPDLRKEDISAGRSINLALSERGLWALDRVGLKEKVLETCIPMHGRMIHTTSSETFLSKYSGRKNEYINSVSRGGLNGVLLDEAEKLDNIKIVFNSKCLKVDLEAATGYFYDYETKEEYKVEADVVIGTDGAGSVVRKSMMNKTTTLLFNYSQDFLRHGYKELSILPDENGNHRIDKNALHIWPRGHFMMIALPNLDGSFTLTMFHPFESEVGFNELTTREKVKELFETEYPDLVPHIPHYLDEYFENPVGTLGTIKCYPWQAFGKILVMGDASHAIVPFYGQGMNASFEDVRVFDDMMDDYDNWKDLLEAFQDARVENTNAIADLAIDNFYEMRDKVADETFIKKRKLEMELEQNHPDYYSKYSLVTFRPEISYSQAMKKGRKQDEYLLEFCSENSNMEGVNQEELVQELNKL